MLELPTLVFSHAPDPKFGPTLNVLMNAQLDSLLMEAKINHSLNVIKVKTACVENVVLIVLHVLDPMITNVLPVKQVSY